MMQRARVAAFRSVVGWAAAVGGLSVVVTSAFYALAPAATAMPGPTPDVTAAMAGAIAGREFLAPIAWIGIPGDVITAAGAIVLAALAINAKDGFSALGLLLIGLSSFLFLTIDITAGSIFTALANIGDRSAFLATKLLFDRLFIGGTMCLALGVLALGIAHRKTAVFPRVMTFGFGFSGLLGLAGGFGALAGQDLAQPMGLSVAISAMLFAWLGVRCSKCGWPEV